MNSDASCVIAGHTLEWSWHHSVKVMIHVYFLSCKKAVLGSKTCFKVKSIHSHDARSNRIMAFGLCEFQALANMHILPRHNQGSET